MKLSKAGYGNVRLIKSLDVATFMNLIHYENYIVEYREEFERLNNGR